MKRTIQLFQMRNALILGLLLVLDFSSAFFNLASEESIKTVTIESGTRLLRKMFFNVGKSYEESTEFGLAVDFEESNIFIGDKDAVGFGIQCRPEYCKPGEPTKCRYHEAAFECVPAELTMNVSLDERLAAPLSKPTPTTVRVFLIKSTGTEFLVPRDGVVGLAPNSELLKVADSEASPSSLTFRIFRPENMQNFLDFEIYYNHLFSHEIFKKENSGQTWAITDGSLKVGDDLLQGPVFLDFTSQSFISFDGAENFCMKQKNEICESIVVCDNKSANYSKAKTVIFSSKNQPEIRMIPQDYLSYDPDTKLWKCYFQDPQTPKNFELGLKMFERFPFSVHFGGQKRYFVLQNQFEEVKKTSVQTWILIGALSAGILICMGLIVWVERQHSKIKIA